jgi:glycosyltransferase involved in cell wall biosynthesis
MISVLILTRNEQQDLPGALTSVAWSNDIHVVDSYSTDDTAAIATAAGAKVHQRHFDNYAAQRNFGLDLPFRYKWVFILDADERPTPALAAEMQRVVRDSTISVDTTISAYRIRRRDFLFATWLKHAQLSPYYIRLVRPRRARYNRSINEVIEVEGPIADLTESLDHHPFSKGIAHWLTKHNQYSTMEAALIHNQQGLRNPSLLIALRHPDFHTRRIHQKAIFYRLPGRPLLKWLYMLFIRGAILDGQAGLTYATLQSIYEYMIVLKTKELARGRT